VDRVDAAIQALESFQPQEGYILAYSGGKDSDVIKRLTTLSGAKYQAVHNLTTVDAPETVKYIQNQTDVEILRPDRSMWQLIVDNKYPPTRIARYCCRELKEKSNVGRVTITGVRKAEGTSRKANQGLITFPQKDDVATIAEGMSINFMSTDKGGWYLTTTTAIAVGW
jgi:phosphoadenosine phosphosulfate reductase